MASPSRLVGALEGFPRENAGKTTKIISVFPAKNISVDK
jgi:hypothetical protein